jgi:uncharacterized membrane-anchored protein
MRGRRAVTLGTTWTRQPLVSAQSAYLTRSSNSRRRKCEAMVSDAGLDKRHLGLRSPFTKPHDKRAFAAATHHHRSRAGTGTPGWATMVRPLQR